MTTADLKRAFMDERPVRYNGITYQRVTAVIYRKTPDKTGLLVQGELLDKNGRAVMIAAAERIEVEETEMTQEIITITVEAGQMTARRKTMKIAQRRPVPVWAIVKYAALTIAGIMLFREGAARALAYRGYFAVGGEVFALFLPVFYYCLSRTVRDLITDIKNGFKPEYEED